MISHKVTQQQTLVIYSLPLTCYLSRQEVHSKCNHHNWSFLFWLAFLLIKVIWVIRQSGFYTCPYIHANCSSMANNSTALESSDLCTYHKLVELAVNSRAMKCPCPDLPNCLGIPYLTGISC